MNLVDRLKEMLLEIEDITKTADDFESNCFFGLAFSALGQAGYYLMLAGIDATPKEETSDD